jgi:hypothetical protein
MPWLGSRGRLLAAIIQVLLQNCNDCGNSETDQNRPATDMGSSFHGWDVPDSGPILFIELLQKPKFHKANWAMGEFAIRRQIGQCRRPGLRNLLMYFALLVK